MATNFLMREPCPLCGEKEHNGSPCYSELRHEWKREDVERWIGSLNANLVEAGSEEILITYSLQTQRP